MSDETIVNPPVDDKPVADPKNELIPMKAYEEVKGDMLKYKQGIRNLEAELEKANAKAKELELAGLRAKEDYKQMYEQEAAAKKEIEGKYKMTVSAVVDSAKWNAISRELISMGLNPDPQNLKDVERLVDFTAIEVEGTTTGRVNVLNAKEFSEKFKSQRPYLFQTPGKTNINTGNPTIITPQNVTMDSVKAAEAEYKKTRSPDAEKRYKEALIAMKRQGLQ